MSSFSKSLAIGGVVLILAASSPAQASPIGTPAANNVPTGKGKHLGGLFDSAVEPHDGDHATTGTSRPARKHLTARQWREAYIAKHGHDLPPLSHPGH